MIRKLELLKNIKSKIPRFHRVIDKHYVYEVKKDHVMVITRYPPKNYKNFFISNNTVEGTNEQQYLTGIVYKVDSTNTSLHEVQEAINYLACHQTAFTQAAQHAPTLPLIELSNYIQ